MRFRVTRFIPASLLTRLKLARNRSRPHRCLEIGPGPRRLRGFETLNIVSGRDVDYVWDASRQLPFGVGTFEVIYCSHTLEHVPWYLTEQTLQEWVRVLAPEGRLEVWVPDGLRLCQALVYYELEGENRMHLDGWARFNEERNPYKWISGRIYAYGDGTGDPGSPNWHRALFTPKHLRQVMERAGLKDIRSLDRADVRGHDHGWINMGMTGTKPR